MNYTIISCPIYDCIYNKQSRCVSKEVSEKEYCNCYKTNKEEEKQ